MNKTDLINQLAQRLDGDKKAAQTAVEGLIDLVQREVQRGENVSISGFGVFEKRARAARTARNPRTGQAVKVKKTTVPAFRPGKYFKDVIAGTVKLPKVTGKPTTARAAAAAAKAPVAAKAPTAANAPTATRTRAAAAKSSDATATPSTTATAAKPATRSRTAAAQSAPSTATKTPRATATKTPAKTAAAKAPAAATAAPAAKAPAAKRAPAKKK